LGPGPDRPQAPEIATAEAFLLDGSWWRTIEPLVEQLN
jgi:hypothetical protein